MKALKSNLAKELLQNNVRIPRHSNAKLEYLGVKYTVQYVPNPKGK